MKEKLVVTNYDNFKNADFFIEQYFKAQDMLKEVNDFFNSFIQSRLFTAKDLNKINPSCFKGTSIYSGDNYWTQQFIGYNWLSSCRVGYYDNEKIEKLEKIKESTKKVCNRINQILTNTEYDCYYLLTENNELEEFIPIASKNSITFDFNKDDNLLRISGFYYHYHEGGAQFGASFSSLDKITKTIILNRENNNIIEVQRNTETIQKGNANGKSYWDDHDEYCLSSMDKHAINTSNFPNVPKLIYNYLHHKSRIFRINAENTPEVLKSLHNLYDENYKKWYHEDLTDAKIRQYNKYDF